MRSKKWYLKRNISCDVHLLNEFLETDVPWDDAIVVSAGKLRKLWDSLSEPRSSVWKTTWKDSSEACVINCQNCAVYSVFRQVWSHTIKSLSLTERVYRPLRYLFPSATASVSLTANNQQHARNDRYSCMYTSLWRHLLLSKSWTFTCHYMQARPRRNVPGTHCLRGWKNLKSDQNKMAKEYAPPLHEVR